jgi:mRNA-degrading endonuclease HigB of HigAB toxin-antitoxin module
VHIVTRKHLSDAVKQHPSAADEIEAWTRIVEAARWNSFLEVSSTFKDADNVIGYVVLAGLSYSLCVRKDLMQACPWVPAFA